MALSRHTPNKPAHEEAVLVNPHQFVVGAMGHGVQVNLHPYNFREPKYACIRVLPKRTCELMKSEQPSKLEVLPLGVGTRLQEECEANAAAHPDWTNEKVFRAAWKVATKREAPSYDHADAAADAIRKIHAMLLEHWKISADPTWSMAKCEAVMRDPSLAWTGPDDLGEGPSEEEVEQQEMALTKLRQSKAQHEARKTKHSAGDGETARQSEEVA
jgi:hypothetical protein